MKRFLLLLSLMLAVAAGAAYALNDYVAGAIFRRVLVGAQELAAARDVALSARLARADFPTLGTIACHGLEGRVRFPERIAGTDRDSFILGARRVSVSVLNPFEGRVRVAIAGGVFSTYDTSGRATGERVSDLNAEFEVAVDWTDQSGTMRKLGEELQRLLHEGWMDLPARIEAVAEFTIGRRSHQVRIRSSSDGERTSVVLDRDDVNALARDYTHPLTEAEIDLVARNPARAPRLLELSERAIESAIAERRRHRNFPYDAYRHVYWSWLLTREFGPEFSETVTDAHEVGATYESGPARRRMDLLNNAVGRAYALAGVPEHEIVDRVLDDPNVVRNPELSTDVPAAE